MYSKIPVFRDRQCNGEGSKSKSIDMPEKKMKKVTFILGSISGRNRIGDYSPWGKLSKLSKLNELGELPRSNLRPKLSNHESMLTAIASEI